MKYYGIYCAQCNEWLLRKDETLLFYPAVELAEAELKTHSRYWHYNSAAVTEYGTERYTPVDELPPSTTLCANVVSERNEKMWAAAGLMGI